MTHADELPGEAEALAELRLREMLATRDDVDQDLLATLPLASDELVPNRRR